MEHSTAIMEDAGAKIDAAAARAPDVAGSDANAGKGSTDRRDHKRSQDDRNGRGKRKAQYGDSSMHQGSRGFDKRAKKGDMGRGEYFRGSADKRQKNTEAREKREAGNGPSYGVQFTQEEIDADGKKPKRKVAVMIGYSGTGYKGMQISPSEKTIEGDLFNAFIAAGAISKANADDPKKVSLVRCARTDKGVHAAGNMISLKLIVEDEDIVKKINDALTPQIRVWGIERTIGSFSCYQACDSRWYEYLIPSHAFLPPHPSSWLAKQLDERAGDPAQRSAWLKRQEDIAGFWESIDENEIKAILETIDADIRWDVVKALQGEDEASAKAVRLDADDSKANEDGDENDEPTTEEGAVADESHLVIEKPSTAPSDVPAAADASTSAASTALADATNTLSPAVESGAGQDAQAPAPEVSSEEADRLRRLREATRRLRSAYTDAKRRYRISEARIDRIQEVLSKFVGTLNFHNFTIQKTYRDPSAKRHIKSFVVNRKPILIGEGPDEAKTQWLSLKIHGQSFMMHQIRKMVGMVALMVRCGSDLARLNDSLGEQKHSIPKVPGLGLLLERPVFDSYNNLQAAKHDREKLLFSKYEKELEAFKEREIYQRIFRVEENRSEFERFFNHIDNFRESYFLFVTGEGYAATKSALLKDA